jgi:hypothetical protein
MNDQMLSALRSVLKIGAGYLVAKNISTQDNADAILAGVLALVGVVWGWYHRVPAPVPDQTQNPK